MANALRTPSYYAPDGSGSFDYPDLNVALNETDDQARLAMYGPQAGLQANLRAANEREAIQEGQDDLARQRRAQAVWNALVPQTPGQAAEMAAYSMPVVGNALSARDAANALYDHDYLGAALSGLGSIPLVGGVFGGIRARTANLAKLSEAGRLMEAGGEPADIYRKTGWFLGADNKWRFEIPDNNLLLLGDRNLPPQRIGDDYVFSRILHPELAKAYGDDLYSGVSGAYGKSFPYAGGTYDPYTRAIESTGPDFLEAKRGVIHELQHAIQDREGFAKGSNFSRITPEQIAAELDEMSKRKTAGGLAGDMTLPEDHAVAFGLYDRHAGEVEARNAELRALLTAQQRRKSFPPYTQDTPNDRQIVNFGY